MINLKKHAPKGMGEVDIWSRAWRWPRVHHPDEKDGRRDPTSEEEEPWPPPPPLSSSTAHPLKPLHTPPPAKAAPWCPHGRNPPSKPPNPATTEAEARRQCRKPSSMSSPAQRWSSPPSNPATHKTATWCPAKRTPSCISFHHPPLRLQYAFTYPLMCRRRLRLRHLQLHQDVAARAKWVGCCRQEATAAIAGGTPPSAASTTRRLRRRPHLPSPVLCG